MAPGQAGLHRRDRGARLLHGWRAEVRPTPWRQAVDLANMMLCLALRSTAERVYQRALKFFTTAEISEAFAAARGLALPSQLRRDPGERPRAARGVPPAAVAPARPGPGSGDQATARPGPGCPVRSHLVRRFPRRLCHDRAAPCDPAGSGRSGPGRAGPGHRRVRLACGAAGRAGAALRGPAAAELGPPAAAGGEHLPVSRAIGDDA
jgi:hypothetical protein